MTSPATSRLIFANQLRGIAALMVLCSHLIGVFWAMRDFVSMATASPPQPGAIPGIYGLVSFTWLNFGPLGVGIFFLISGLVIPISLQRHTRLSFLLARILRIFPTYILAVAIDVAAVHLASAYWGRPFPYDPVTILANALLSYNLVGLPSIDLVNWTLCIELKFYVLMLVLAPQIQRGSLAALFVPAILILLGNAAFDLFGTSGFVMRHSLLLQSLSIDSTYLVFMMLGVLFNYHLRGSLRPLHATVAMVVMGAIFLACWKLGALQIQYPIVTVNYCYAFVIFGAAYSLRRHARPFAPLDGLAAISFPLYLIHSLVGFLSLKVCMLVIHMSYLSSLAAAFTVVVLLAILLHCTIEIRSTKYGHDLARKSAFV